ncbi:MAG TPA: BatD family protein, partial [Deltaproteobacteria bacterium]|nr:BatD family protein [Deltaproteobacteria bacterium]
MKRYAVLVAVFMMLVPLGVSAADRVTLSLDRTEATTKDAVKMTVGISVSGQSGTPVIEGLEAFHISPGGTSTNIEFVNNRMSKRTDYIYYIQPQKPGTYRIGPAEARVGGKAYRSNTVELVVSKATDGAGQVLEQVFLKAEVSKKRSYVQEPLIYLLKLYRRLEVSNLSLNLPEASGLNLRKLGDPLEYQSAYAGQQYNVLELRYEIVPEHAGTYTIEGASMGMT